MARLLFLIAPCQQNSGISFLTENKRNFNIVLFYIEIAKAVGLAATTVRPIRDRDGDKIREAAKSATSLDA